VAQAYYAKQEGLDGFATETGAGQWGSALCFATQLFGLKCKVTWSPLATIRNLTAGL
jgi:tryptophan synthase beta chain